MKLGNYYGRDYGWFVNGQDTFKNIKWEGGALMYHYSVRDASWLTNGDCLQMMNNWLWCQVTTPKILKGKYKLTSYIVSGWVSYDVYVDDVYITYVGKKEALENISWGKFDWDKTESHTVRIVKRSGDILFWDTITFAPVEDEDK